VAAARAIASWLRLNIISAAPPSPSASSWHLPAPDPVPAPPQ
jgi:hypothetical protein